MAELSISIDYLQRLISKVRGVQGVEGEVIPDDGSNPSDDREFTALQDRKNDPNRQEIQQEIRGLNRRQQAELVALMWVGRGDAEPDDWEETVRLAGESRERPTEDYLLGEPLVADFWANGLDALAIEMPGDDSQTQV